METIQITLPSSKSLSNRWLTLDYMSRNGIRIKNLSSADDTQLLKRLYRQAKVGRRHVYDCRDSGTAARFLIAQLAITQGTHTVTGSERLCQRPFAPLIDTLRSLGANITYTEREGFLPISIRGNSPTVTRIKVDGSQSSQFVSAILLAGAAMPQGLAVEVTGEAVSQPYIQMTIDVLNKANIPCPLKGNPPAYFIEHTLPQIDMVTIEKDWTAASYFYNAVAFAQNDYLLHLAGLNYPSTQGDSAVFDLYSQFGVESTINGNSIDIRRVGPPVDTFEYDFRHTSDLFPSVAVACAALGIEAHFTGLSTLRLKESDRIEAVATELRRLGCLLEVTDSEMWLHRSTITPQAPIPSYNDHRIVMAFSTLKTRYPNIEVLDHNVVSKSFPTFFAMLERLV